MRAMRWTALAAVAAIAAACGGRTTSAADDVPADAGHEGVDIPKWDTPKDVAPDSPPDVAPDVAPDTVPDVAPDSAPDTAPDAVPDESPEAAPDGAEPDDVPAGDTGSDAGEDPAADPAPDTAPEGGPDATGDPGDAVTPIECDNAPLTPPASGACEAFAGSDWTLVRGDLLAPGGIVRNGHLLIDPAGRIACAGCDCSGESGFDGATRIDCARGLVTPGLINAHDHLGWAGREPTTHGDERYDHRHDWRCGLNGHTELSPSSTSGGQVWGEIRNLMAGATSIFGSGKASGLLRNLDEVGYLGGGIPDAEAGWFDTFPLGDSKCAQLQGSCQYPKVKSSGTVGAEHCYVPHVAEGINAEARNEFVCVQATTGGGQDLMLSNAAFIHGIGALPTDVGAMARDGTALVWSPRSNIDLYGNTAPVSLYRTLGVTIALGTDWTPSGSMNILRELKCADAFNRLHLRGAFTDRELVDMATSGAAKALHLEGRLGALAKGLLADVAVFDASAHPDERAVIDAEPADVVLVLRAGNALYGDAALVAALGASSCPKLDVCGASKRLCEGGNEFEPAGVYPLFFCGLPRDEPSCAPMRPGEYTGAVTYDDRDGDGVRNDDDNCPDVFNPARPADGYAQGDYDGDGAGDVCDPCPWDAGATTCSAVPALDPTDPDGDGVKTGTDLCPVTPDPDQVDTDQDGKGDRCDACPSTANPGSEPCPPPPAPAVRVWAVKTGVATGRARIEGVLVTGVGSAGYFVAEDPAAAGWLGVDHSGLYVYHPEAAPFPKVGDRVTVEGTVQPWWGEIELAKITLLQVTATGLALPAAEVVAAPDVATGGPRAEALEGALVRVAGVEVTDVAPAPAEKDPVPTYEFEVAGVLRVNDFLWRVDPFPLLGTQFISLTGLLHWSYENSKIEPRGPGDLESVPPAVAPVGLSPSLLHLVEGDCGRALVRLNRAADEDFAVAVDSADDLLVLAPASVTVLAGQKEAGFDLCAGTLPAEGPDTTTVTATAGEVVLEAQVRVLAADGSPALASVVPATLDLFLGGDGPVTVVLDVPALWGDVTIGVASDPAGVVTHEAAAVVPSGAIEVAFAVHAAAIGDAVLTFTLGDAAPLTVPVRVIEAAPVQPSVDGEVIVTEFMARSQSGTGDTGEWVELYNATTRLLELQGCRIQDDGTNSHQVGASVVMEPGAYVVLAASADPGKNHALPPVAYAYGEAFVLGNSGDEIELVCGDVEIDKVVYTSSKVVLAKSASLDMSNGKWCGATTPYSTSGGTTWYGTPGAANPPCP